MKGELAISEGDTLEYVKSDGILADVCEIVDRAQAVAQRSVDVT